jgi:hypothetical protein
VKPSFPYNLLNLLSQLSKTFKNDAVKYLTPRPGICYTGFLVDTLKTPDFTLDEEVSPASPAGIFLEHPVELPKPPDDFAPGFVNLGPYQLFTGDREYDFKEYQEAAAQLSGYFPDDVKAWVTPDYVHIYVFVKIGAENKSSIRKKHEKANMIGQVALPKDTV